VWVRVPPPVPTLITKDLQLQKLQKHLKRDTERDNISRNLPLCQHVFRGCLGLQELLEVDPNIRPFSLASLGSGDTALMSCGLYAGFVLSQLPPGAPSICGASNATSSKATRS
jgi:hypothetical protein